MVTYVIYNQKTKKFSRNIDKLMVFNNIDDARTRSNSTDEIILKINKNDTPKCIDEIDIPFEKLMKIKPNETYKFN